MTEHRIWQLVSNKMAQDIIMTSSRPVDDSAARNAIQIPGIKTKKRPFFIGVAGGTCCGKVDIKWQTFAGENVLWH